MRNNVTRLLTARKIPFQTLELPEKKWSAREAALLLNIAPELIYKTIVLRRTQPGKIILALVPANAQVDPKLVADALGEKKVRTTTQAEAESLTGLQAGGISPLALLQGGFETILDRSAKEHNHLHVSAGQRGLMIRLPVDDLVALTRARLAKIARFDQDSA